MKITKLRPCCLLIKEGGLQILTDPGAWSTGQNEVRDIGFQVFDEGKEYGF